MTYDINLLINIATFIFLTQHIVREYFIPYIADILESKKTDKDIRDYDIRVNERMKLEKGVEND